MGDALAVALLEARGFTPEDFALSHPGGALGRKLLLRVNDIMHTGDEIPHVSKEASLRDALLEITRKNLGMTVVCDDLMKIQGSSPMATCAACSIWVSMSARSALPM
jgi:arabinose-5-phosphate isomerase